ncbi:hypothetical protein CspeluHIS016_0201870 [Cutaneotrichosporon spelunceum]|uniref:ATP synthase subunit d, mitochondrial n=1 Tax=Cutaneotrichosporon spelunceum TaxID=1672016 RepID=A0AAD3Y9P8_9TREE|nr:hypothetical protein CspeluHIS016_0201870 [Cutaneotrichosporon spelunceum]
MERRLDLTFTPQWFFPASFATPDYNSQSALNRGQAQPPHSASPGEISLRPRSSGPHLLTPALQPPRLACLPLAPPLALGQLSSTSQSNSSPHHSSKMSAAARTASANVDWSKIYTSLGLNKETLAQLQAFRARNSNAQNKNAALKASIPEIDLSHYKSVLKDQRAVDQASKVLADFKPIDYDVKKFDDIVGAFEKKAVDAAKATVAKVSAEEESLRATLSNIKDARPFEDLTSLEVGHAAPEVTKAVETAVKKGRWTVPGYRETYGEQSLM